jgi:hypothetical protein
VRELDAREFDAELRGVFPHTAILVQNRFECFGIYPTGEAPAAEARMDGADAALGAAHFFIGMCSRRPLPPLASFIYVPRAANLLREREMHIAKLDKWLADVRERLENAERRIVELQEELAVEQQTARRQIDELEAENRSKTEWAEGVQRELNHCADLLTTAENTVVERSAWAQRLDAQLRETERQLAAVAGSRWHRFGRKLRVGPVIPLLEKPAG